MNEYGSRKSYDEIWKNIISPSIINYKDNIPFVECSTTAMEEIWVNYTKFNEHCKKTYMVDSEGRLDRHKVSACYILAILKAYPLKYTNTIKEGLIFTLNEHLAIQVGFSIMRAFITAPVDEDEKTDFPPINPDEDKHIFGKEISYPDSGEIYHGEYRKNFAIELYFTHKEDNYNILSLSHTLYLLELYNRQKNTIKELQDK